MIIWFSFVGSRVLVEVLFNISFSLSLLLWVCVCCLFSSSSFSFVSFVSPPFAFVFVPRSQMNRVTSGVAHRLMTKSFPFYLHSLIRMICLKQSMFQRNSFTIRFPLWRKMVRRTDFEEKETLFFLYLLTWSQMKENGTRKSRSICLIVSVDSVLSPSTSLTSTTV